VQKQALTQNRLGSLPAVQPHIGSLAGHCEALVQLRWQVQIPAGPGPPQAHV
jgi:hypothetical protein